MENIGQNTRIVNRLLLVKESNEMTGWTDALAKIIRDAHRSLEKTGKEVGVFDKGMEEPRDIISEEISEVIPDEISSEMDDFSL